MPRPTPHHFITGLQGGYSPDVVEHYDSKGVAIEVLAEWKDQMWDIWWEFPEDRPIGDVRRDNLIQYRAALRGGGYYDYALIEPCEIPDECELANEGELL